MLSHLNAGIVALCATLLFTGLSERVARKWKVAARKCAWSAGIAGGAVLVAGTASYAPGSAYSHLQIAVLCAALAVSTISDLRYGYVFDAVTVPAALLILMFAYLNGSIGPAGFAGGLCAAFMLLLFLISAGRGIGLGDLKLAACMGLALGLIGGFLALAASFIVGGVHGACLLISRRAQRGDTLRFAPYLAFGSLVSIAATLLTV
ncbi:MAG: hypothetical protein NVSMB31_03780 [Vulcanimicrobiaceae bacterium]